MKNIRDSFLDQFDSVVRTEIIQFGKRISQICLDYDVVIFMARKAVCFSESLKLLKLTKFQGVITSDRILDMDTAWLKNKKVALIDDALISGSTLYNTIIRLNKAGVKKVDTHVLCINKKWYCEDLVKPKEPFLELNDNETAALCFNIVSAMSLIPRPYAVDFPLFSDIRLPLHDINVFSAIMDWRIDEVSTSLQKKHNVFSLTHTPNHDVIKQLCKEIDWGLPSGSNIKIRFYGRFVDQDRKYYWCNLMPIVALEPLSKNQLNNLYHCLELNIPEVKENITPYFNNINEDSNLKSKLRLLQYVISSRLANLWLSNIKTIVSSRIKLSHNIQNLAYLFPPKTIDIIHRISTSTAPLLSNAEKYIPPDNSTFPAHNMIKRKIPNDIKSIKNIMGNKFLELYQKKELKARRIIFKNKKRAFDDPKYKQIVSRLSQGYSLNEIRSWINSINKQYDTNKIVSLFIDTAIDKGAIVPIICVKNNFVYRAFRHGEDVLFNEELERLAVIMLDSYVKSSQQEFIPQVEIEKLLVLFLRIGIEQGLLIVSDYPLGDYQSIGIRYSLHGAVVGSYTNKLYKVNDKFGLTDILRRNGYLRQKVEENTKGYEWWKIIKVPQIGYKPESESNVKNIGLLFGEIVGEKSKKNKSHIDIQQLTTLATCTYPKDVAGALAGSIDWTINDTNRLLSTLNQFKSSKNKPKDSESLSVGLRKRVGFTAVNSGVWKYNNYIKKASKEIINKIYNGLGNEIYQNLWISYWPKANYYGSKSIPENLNSLIFHEGHWLIQMYLLWLIIEISLLYYRLTNTSDKDEIATIQDSVEKALKKGEELIKDMPKKYVSSKCVVLDMFLQLKKDYATLTFDHVSLFNSAVDVIKYKIKEAQGLLEEVDIIAATYGKPENVVYSYNVLNISHIEEKDLSYQKKMAIRNIFDTFYIKSKKTQKSQAASFKWIESQHQSKPGGIWITVVGNYARSWLLRYALDVIDHFKSDGHIRCSLYANLNSIDRIFSSNNYNNCFENSNFWNKSKIISSHLYKKRIKGLAIITNDISPESGRDIGGLKKVMLKTKSLSTLEIASPYPQKINIAQYKTKNVKGIQMSPSSKTASVGIITIIPEEMNAVVNFMKKHKNYEKIVGSDKVFRIFHHCSFPASKKGSHQIVCTQTQDQGNRSIANAYNDLVTTYNPYIIFLVGTAGGIHDKLDLCDVVIAKEIYYYDDRIIAEDGVNHRLIPYSIEGWLKIFINDFLSSYKGAPKIKVALPGHGKNFRVYYDPLGTGEAVVKSELAEILAWLKTTNDKVLAVEKEAAGFAQSYEESKLRYACNAKGYLVVRGISDHANKKKKDNHQNHATSNAMKFIQMFLSRLPFNYYDQIP